MSAPVSQGAYSRLPQYLILLNNARREGRAAVTSAELGGAIQVSASQVRRDLSVCGVDPGPSDEYDVADLIPLLRHVLGYDDMASAVVVGAGHLGRALLSYPFYSEYGVDVVAAFDADESLAGQEIGGKPVLPVSRLTSLCRKTKVQIGIITVPAAHAQEVCDKLVEGGIQAIWNFAPIHLKTPEHVLVKNEIIALSLGELSRQLRQRQEPL